MSAADRDFFYSRSELDSSGTERFVSDVLSGCDDGELFLERRRSESLVFDDGRLRGASYDSAKGFGLRAVAGPVAGYAHSTELTGAALARAAERAPRNAALPLRN